ncbi:MAG: DNA gyrase subunit A [bacterium]|nr:DNA gyrase subunit A [bacterium]
MKQADVFENGNFDPIDIVDEMKSSYLDYAMSVIVSRALPDVRDGLKPVHRRILYGMEELGANAGRPYKKSARIVGDVMGKYHPHGDSAIYDTLVRMVQPFSLRYPLIDGQGNFGSVDGDGAAAMRYTESRLARIAEEMLADLEKNTVPFGSNYDDSLKEPLVLPSKLPNLLVNGSSGIAVGMATNIPPHNLREVVWLLEAILDNPELTNEELIQIPRQHGTGMLFAPDFPTGGIIQGVEGIRDAYTTGRGRIVVRGLADIEETDKGNRQRIIIKEIPYQVNKGKLIERIVELVNDGKIEGISDIRDESDREGMRVVIELKRDVMGQQVLNALFAHTTLQSTFGVILIALVDGAPKVCTLRDLCTKFIEHRLDIIIKRAQFDLNKARDRLHIALGLRLAVDDIDRVVAIIRAAKNVEEARNDLMAAFSYERTKMLLAQLHITNEMAKVVEGQGLSEEQAKAILEMRLSRLTGLERQKLEDEIAALRELILELEYLLSHPERQRDEVKKELTELTATYGDERRTKIVLETGDIGWEDLIPNEEMLVTISHQQYVKRLPVSALKRQNRGGKGLQATKPKETDWIDHLFTAMMHDTLLIFTNQGRCLRVKVYEIPQMQRASRGTPIVNLIQIDRESGEEIRAVLPAKDFNPELYIVFVTRLGKIKKTSLDSFKFERKTGIRAISLRDGDDLVQVLMTDGTEQIVIGTNYGKSIRFDEESARPMGRDTEGVKGITLSHGDTVIGCVSVPKDVDNRKEITLLAVTNHGFGKRSTLDEYRVQGRGGQGIMTVRVTQRVGPMIALILVTDADDLMVITTGGTAIRQSVAQIRVTGRATQGVRLIKLGDGEAIADIARVAPEPEEEGEDAGNGTDLFETVGDS